MVYITKETNHKDRTKHEQEWQENLKQLSLVLNGTETDDTKKKSKQLESLFNDQKEITEQIKKLDDQKKKHFSELKLVKNIIPQISGATKEKARVNTLYTDTTHGQVKMDAFKTGWRTHGWNKIAKDHHTPTTAGEKVDNLYQIRGYTITEEQVVKLLAKVVHELSAIDKSEWASKYTGTDKTTLTPYLDHIIEQGNAIRAMNEKGNYSQEVSKKVYDLPQTYTKKDNTPYTTNPFNFTEVFTFLKNCDDSLLDKLNQKSKDDISQSETWRLVKSGEAYTKEQLANFGITIDASKTTMYRSVKEVGGEWTEEAEEVLVKDGLKGWVNLLKEVLPLDPASNPVQKLIKAYTNSPTELLFTDLRAKTATSNGTNDIFVSDDGYDSANHNKTTSTAPYRLPESEEEVDNIIQELEAKKIAGAVQESDLNKKITELKGEITTKQAEMAPKNTEIAKLVQEIITKKREELTTYNISKGFKKDATADNRRTFDELWKIQQLLLTIRYLANDGDATQDSSEASENTALTEIEDILEQTRPWSAKCGLVDSFQSLGYKKDGDGQIDYQQAISRIKAGKYTEDGKEHPIRESLAQYLENFTNKEKLVKLNGWELAAKKALEDALGEKDNHEEKLSDWQTELKKIDAQITDTLITEDWKTKWGTVPKHQKISEITARLTSAKKTDAKTGEEYKDFFDTISKGEAGYTTGKDIKDWPTLLAQEPKVIITLIERYKYENMEDTGDDKDKKKTQQFRRILKKLNKKGTDTLTDDELNEAVYKVAVGELVLDSTKFFKADLSEYTTETPEENDTPGEENKSWFVFGGGNYRPYITYIGGFIVLVGAGMAIFWKHISGWWNGPAEEEGVTEKETEEEDDDK